MLNVHNLQVSYGVVRAVDGMTLRIGRGEVVALVGANGAGKSSVLNALMGLVPHDATEMTMDGIALGALATRERIGAGISLSPEGRHVFPQLTVRENIMLGTSNRGRLPKKQMQEEVAEMFDIFPVIKPFENALGWTLSGGQQQMLAVARGLMAKPKLLLLDEPSLGLAPVIVQQLFATIRVIHARGTTILLVEQNANMALSVANRGYVLETGEMKIEGSPKELLGNEEVRAAYLGGHG